MSYVKPLAMAATLALGLTGVVAFAAAHPANIPAPQPSQQTAPPATYYIADAGTAKAHRVYYFTKLDRNHDGVLSRSEIPKDMWRLRTNFIYADWNHNHRLSPAEYLMWEKHTAPSYSGVFHVLTFVYGNNH